MPQPNSACDKSARAGYSQAAIAAERSLPLLRDVHGVVGRIVDEASHDLPLALERDRNREMRNRMQKVGRRVERVDVPGVALVGAFDPPAFLHDEAVTGARLLEFLIERLFRALVGEADEIAWPLHRHLQFANLAEIALQAPAGLDRGGRHHSHQGGADH